MHLDKLKVEPAADQLSRLGKNLNKTSKLVWLIHSAMPRLKSERTKNNQQGTLELLGALQPVIALHQFGVIVSF